MYVCVCQDKTDKALDAWAALQEKHTNLERHLLVKQEEEEEQVRTWQAYIAKLEKENTAIKKGMAQMILEEEVEDETFGRNRGGGGGHKNTQGGGGIGEMFAFALSCATGGPLGDMDVDEMGGREGGGGGIRQWEASTAAAAAARGGGGNIRE
jgi:uncharacterized protein YbaA (DUF1428 family)